MRTISKTFFLFILAITLTAMPGFTSRSAQLTEEDKLAIRLIKLIDIPVMIPQLSAQLHEAGKQLARERNPDITDDQLKIVEQELTKVMQGQMLKLVLATAELYKLHFQRQDLENMVNFYESPTGRHVIKTLPQIQIDALVLAARWLEQSLPLFIEAVADQVKGKGIQL